MYTGRRFPLPQTVAWSQREWILPAMLAFVAVGLYEGAGMHFLALPWLPISAIAVAVAFYLGFKNNASYDRLWEARKIYGAIVNASRSWAFTSRDFVSNLHAEGEPATAEELSQLRAQLVHRHVAWMDALRHQLRKVKPWEHQGDEFDQIRRATGVAEVHEDLREVLLKNLDEHEVTEVLAQINPAARLLANQSRQLAELRQRGLLDCFRHMELQQLLIELMTQQGRAERIKNFPFPRQYATVNFFFAGMFTLLVPFGMLHEFAALGEGTIWLTVPFSTMVSWVYLTTDRIGDWSENPFEGLVNDVPITSMTRGIERDVLQMLDETDLPEPRPAWNEMQF